VRKYKLKGYWNNKMSNSMFPKHGSDAEQARSRFENSREILREATKLLTPTIPSEESKAALISFRKASERLISLLEKGFTTDSIDSIDREAHTIVQQCLKIQRATLNIRAGK
jgi:hypothetical protein